MVVDFQIAPSLNYAEPGQEYFQGLEFAALRVANKASVQADDAWAICEYLDAVDAGDLAIVRKLYRSCVDALAGYLEDNVDLPAAQALANKSFAAATLLEVLLERSCASRLPHCLVRVA